MKNIIIKILLIFIVLTGLLIAALNMLGGTSEAHKNGLESAFSSALHGNVQLGELKSFNLFPQFSVDVKDMEATGVMGQGSFHANEVKFSFDLISLILKRQSINQLDISGLFIEKGILTNASLDLSAIKINSTVKNDRPFLSITGKYGTFPLEIKVDMEQIGTSLPLSYKFGKENPFTLGIGKTDVSGDFTPGTKENTALQNLKISRNGKACTSLPEKNKFTMQNFTTYIFSEIVTSEKEKTDIEKLCKDITKFGL